MSKVLLGMSGGVDSSTAAALLMRAGHEVIGATLVMHDIHKKDAAAAKAVADALGIPHHTVDMREDFEKHVLSPFVAEYESGRTPNPCVLCNGYIKFPALLKTANDLGSTFSTVLADDHVPRPVALDLQENTRKGKIFKHLKVHTVNVISVLA
jgi:tRNA-specific 2-thiouridylase